MSDGSQVFKVYCDFTSEPSFIWTLVESFELIKRSAFRYDFLTDIPIRADDPQFSEHRLPLSARTHLLIDATHIRATQHRGQAVYNYQNSELSVGRGGLALSVICRKLLLL